MTGSSRATHTRPPCSCGDPSARLFYPPNLAWAWSGFLKAFPSLVGLQAACSALFLLLAAFYLRRLRLGLGRRRARDLIGSPRPAIGDDPMLWKEWYVPSRLSRTAVRLAAILLGVLRCARCSSQPGLPSGSGRRVGGMRRPAWEHEEICTSPCVSSMRGFTFSDSSPSPPSRRAASPASVSGGPGRVWRRPSSAAAKSSLPRFAPFGPCEGCPCPF